MLQSKLKLGVNDARADRSWETEQGRNESCAVLANGPIQQKKVKLLGLIPFVAATYPSASVTEVGELYKADLPSPHLLSTEFRCWKTKYS